MFGIGAQELAVILVVALLIFGPKRLPELARSLGKGLAEFRRASSDLRQGLSLEDDPATRRPERPTAPAQTAVETGAAEHTIAPPERAGADEPAGAQQSGATEPAGTAAAAKPGEATEEPSSSGG